MTMARLEFGILRDAWRGEARDFTPLLAEQLDMLGTEIGVDLVSVGKVEVATAGGRSIDIVGQATDGTEFVIENQYGQADHDHLTCGLAYAVARQARGLVVVAEKHRDEFRAVAQYLNELVEHDPERGIAVWLVEAKAVRIQQSAWAPLFTAVVKPNAFTASVEQAKRASVNSVEDFLSRAESTEISDAIDAITARWVQEGHHLWWPTYTDNYVTLAADGPAKGGRRSIINLYRDGRVMVPLSAYAGQNSGKPISALTAPEFLASAEERFGFDRMNAQPSTPAGWLTLARVEDVVAFALDVAGAYRLALAIEAEERDV